MTACLATVVSGLGSKWIVAPLIIENDGTDHPPITVTVRDGITPNPLDTVLILFMKNNLDLEPINRFFKESESNGVIVGVIEDVNGFTLTGDYKFIGNLTVIGNITATGTISAVGDIKSGPPGAQVSLKLHLHPNNAPAPGPTGAPIPTP